MNKKLMPGMALILLSGCSMMPTYERPAAPVPATWNGNGSSNTGRDIVNTAWQDYFPDPRLQVLIASALQNNRDLRIATARIAEARALYGVQRADRLPTVDLGGSFNESVTPASSSSIGSKLKLKHYDLDVSVVSFELDFWGRVSSLTEAAKASYLATESAQRAFRLSLIADVASAYLSLLELTERTQLTVATLSSRAETRELLARRRELGISSDIDLLQADGSYQAALADRADLEQQQAAAANLLDLLVGQSLREMRNLPEGKSLKEQGIVPDLLAGLPSEVLLQRPDVLAAEQQLIAANANIGAARAAFFPSINLSGSLGFSSGSLTSLFSSDSGAWSFQPLISLPLFDAGRTAANFDVAAARKVIAVAQYEKTIQQAFREVADLLSAREKIAEQLAAQTANAQTQKRLLTLVEARYKAGIANHLEVLDAEREAYTAEQLAVQVRRVWLSSATQLYKALAGESNRSVTPAVNEITNK